MTLGRVTQHDRTDAPTANGDTVCHARDVIRRTCVMQSIRLIGGGFCAMAPSLPRRSPRQSVSQQPWTEERVEGVSAAVLIRDVIYRFYLY